jgi:hypothetical protein
MKKLALGIATAVLLATAAVPAMAQVGFYAGPGGVGVDVGAPAPYYSDDCGYYDLTQACNLKALTMSGATYR